MSKRVIVVGGGNAALCAALSARENGADVVVLERADGDLKGGNTAFTAGAMRVAYEGVDDLLTLMPELTEDELATTDFGSYPASDFFDDIARVTEYRTDPELASVLADESLPTLQWMNKQGVRFVPIYGRQAFKIDGRFKFWGGLTVEVSGGGPGLVDALTKAAANAGVQVEYGARVLSLVAGDQGVTGVTVRQNGVTREEHADAVILASGGFQANTAWRTQYLGPNWDLAKVRGTQFNTGDGHDMALRIGASPAGNWSGCHAVSWELNAPEFGDMAVGDHFQKHSYPWSVMINAEGKRFVDEGADFRNYTYAKYGRRVLEQPGQFAWQVFDSKVSHLLRDEYRIKQVTKVTANTLEELAKKMDGVDPEGFLAEIRAYNAAIDQDVAFDPNVKDGRGTTGLAVNKTNWANTIEDGPFEAYAVTCGITFTFGGLRINPDAQVLDTDQRVIPNLYAAGEIVGGVFYFNYPGGSGLTNGSVFGKIAGANAAR
ncbi:FAD-dependent tricarballylate dehydrogenase TcuA [Nocardioides sp.]|uniref:FAD-dependent tricarballylate dehydrogenase TcuA n=1 Tax=Nocardioides sp. TaxID=35761 RepID=UPI002616A792|nr:FAD-dependent tricarballylate dehydrogenase TcuA [Nocardioides sp.]MCW2738791.1 tricarballylate dehydrogenase [Nocardioides sp.]